MNETTNTSDNNSRNFTHSELIKALDAWTGRCTTARDGHYTRAEKLFYRSQILGYILICATVFVTVFSFYPFSPSDTLIWNITKQHIVIFMGCISAIISGIVTQARHGERAETHRASGAQYANLAREFEALKLKFNTKTSEYTDTATKSEELIAKWNSLAKDSPLTPHAESNFKLHIISAIAVIFVFLFFVVAHHTKAEQTPNKIPTQQKLCGGETTQQHAFDADTPE